MFRMKKKLVNMKAIARQFILDNKLNRNVEFALNSSLTHRLTRYGKLIPYSASSVYNVTEMDENRTIKDFDSCDRIVISMHSIYRIAEENKRNPEEYLMEVLSYIKDRLSESQDPTWKGLMVLSGGRTA